MHQRTKAVEHGEFQAQFDTIDHGLQTDLDKPHLILRQEKHVHHHCENIHTYEMDDDPPTLTPAYLDDGLDSAHCLVQIDTAEDQVLDTEPRVQPWVHPKFNSFQAR